MSRFVSIAVALLLSLYSVPAYSQFSAEDLAKQLQKQGMTPDMIRSMGGIPGQQGMGMPGNMGTMPGQHGMGMPGNMGAMPGQQGMGMTGNMGGIDPNMFAGTSNNQMMPSEADMKDMMKQLESIADSGLTAEDLKLLLPKTVSTDTQQQLPPGAEKITNAFKKINQQPPFSLEELDKFIEVWPKFRVWSKQTKKDKTMLNNMKLNHINPQVRSYLAQMGWNAERFFTVVARAFYGVTAITTQKEMQKATKDLKKQRQQIEQSSEMPINEKNMLLYQIDMAIANMSQLPPGPKVTKSEKELIMARIPQIQAIMKK